MAATAFKEDLNAFLLMQLECPVCYRHVTPPVLMCKNGHNVCNDCLGKLVDCPVCKVAKPSYRNLFVEETCAKVSITCENLKYGCDTRCDLLNYKLHSARCSYRIDCRVRYSDENKKCEWVGSSKQALKQHVLNSHPGHHLDGFIAEINCKINNNRNLFFARLVSTYKKLFWICLEYYPEGQLLYAYVNLVGSEKNSSKFKYSFKFTSPKIQRTLTFQSQCHCLHSKNESTRVLVPFQRDLINIFTQKGEIECELRIHYINNNNNNEC